MGEKKTEKDKERTTATKIKYRLNVFHSALSVVMDRYGVRHLNAVDTETGENFGPISEFIPQSVWNQMSQIKRRHRNSFLEVTKNTDLDAWFACNMPIQAYRLLNYMVAIMYNDSSVRQKSHSDLAKELNVGKSTIVRSIRYLKAIEAIIQEETDTTNYYYVNPIIARKQGVKTFFYISPKFSVGTQDAMEKQLKQIEGFDFKL